MSAARSWLPKYLSASSSRVSPSTMRWRMEVTAVRLFRSRGSGGCAGRRVCFVRGCLGRDSFLSQCTAAIDAALVGAGSRVAGRRGRLVNSTRKTQQPAASPAAAWSMRRTPVGGSAWLLSGDLDVAVRSGLGLRLAVDRATGIRSLMTERVHSDAGSCGGGVSRSVGMELERSGGRRL